MIIQSVIKTKTMHQIKKIHFNKLFKM